MKTIRFGLIGCGTHGHGVVVPAMRDLPGVKLAAVAELLPENLAKLEDKSIAGYSDYREMLTRERLDAVYVATRVETHYTAVMASLRAGLHVITEKPMANSVRECRLMNRATERAGRLLAVDFETRYYPGFRQIRQWIDAGSIGKVRAVHLDHMWDGHKAGDERRRRFLDSSGCLDCGIHKLDLARYFCSGAWQDIQARGVWFDERVKYPPHISILARLDTGVLVTLNASFAFTAYIKKRIAGSVYDGLAILGDKGVIVLHQNPKGKKNIELLSESLQTVIPFVEKGHGTAITLLLADFAKAVRAGRPLPPEIAGGYDGLMAQLCADKANLHAVQREDSGKQT